MNDTDAKIKQQIVEKIKASTNILVTVSRDPSVDELSAAIGFTALLNKLNKHATAIFSGALPPAINFLTPEKVFENTADSLRDFIIALDKEKADHLRYKVEGDVVKIFITPYRTTITSNDLDFSQGDFNVELVLALGVENREHLDAAITAHGGILDGVTIATLSDGMQTSQLGDLGWNDKNASCLSEMIVAVVDSLKAEKTDKTLLDKQISTALLTGIVAATDRFSNTRTTSRIMTVAAQLMAAGADQQLIAARLQESHQISSLKPAPEVKETAKPATADAVAELDVIPEVEPEPTSTLPPNNLVIHHDDEAESETSPQDESTLISDNDIPLPQPEEEGVSDDTASTLPPIEPELNIGKSDEEPIVSESTSTLPSDTSVEPSMGGTLSATAEQAAEDSRRDIEDDKNKTILEHAYLDGTGSGAGNNTTSQLEHGGDAIDIFAGNSDDKTAAASPPVGQPTFLGEKVIQPPSLEDLPLPPPLPDFSTLPPPAIPDLNMPYPTVMPGPFVQPPSEPTPPPTSAPIVDDPTKFRIPGQ